MKERRGTSQERRSGGRRVGHWSCQTGREEVIFTLQSLPRWPFSPHCEQQVVAALSWWKVTLIGRVMPC